MTMTGNDGLRGLLLAAGERLAGRAHGMARRVGARLVEATDTVADHLDHAASWLPSCDHLATLLDPDVLPGSPILRAVTATSERLAWRAGELLGHSRLLHD